MRATLLLFALLVLPASPARAVCPADLNHDDIVDFGDLVALLAAWGPCAGCPADFDGSGDVGLSDLLVTLSSWGPCPPPQPGACCYLIAPGVYDCDLLLPEDCTGTFHGEGVSCAEIPPPPQGVGACVFEPHGCAELTPEECAAAGGTWSPGTCDDDCSNGPPPPPPPPPF